MDASVFQTCISGPYVVCIRGVQLYTKGVRGHDKTPIFVESMVKLMGKIDGEDLDCGHIFDYRE